MLCYLVFFYLKSSNIVHPDYHQSIINSRSIEVIQLFNISLVSECIGCTVSFGAFQNLSLKLFLFLAVSFIDPKASVLFGTFCLHIDAIGPG